MKTKIFSALLSAFILFNVICSAAAAKEEPFELVSSEKIESLGGTAYYYKHIKTGAEVVYLDNGSEEREFAVGFKTPPKDSKGANHVLEHSLLCGSEKYPTKNIMHYLQGGALATNINAVTSDDYTYYIVQTPNETEFYNLLDVYLDGIFHPLLLRDENIFRREGIRLEYSDGSAKYNGVVYNELRIKNFDTAESSVNFLSDKLYKAIYGDTAPSFSAGGSLDEIKKLTYEDLLKVYNTYYIPSNSMTFLSGRQDIDKTLAALDSYFKDFDRKTVEIKFEDTKRIPEKPIEEYNVTAETKKVDIGFMSSGVLMSEDIAKRFARDIIFSIIYEKMESVSQKNYICGGNGGGISNVALLCAEVPIEKKDEVIEAYNNILKELGEKGFDEAELDREISEYIESKDPFFEGVDTNIFDGIIYQGDPFICADTAAVEKYLRENKGYFNEVLKKYFTENPCSVVVVSGGGVQAESEPILSAEELEKLKKDTEEFNRWADEPDDPKAVANIPRLTIDEVKDAPEVVAPKHEKACGIDFYLTEKDGDYAGIFLPLDISADDLDMISLLYFYLESRLGEEGVYIGLLPMENRDGEINPQFMIGIEGGDKADKLRKTVGFLKREELWDEDVLTEYIKTAPSEILKNGYRDPYYLSYELKQSALSPGLRFYAQTIGSVQQGSPRYYRFLKSLDENDSPELIAKMKEMTAKIMNGVPKVEYIGKDGYEEFKAAVTKLFGENENVSSSELRLPLGYNSAVTITPLSDANHFMMAGTYDYAEYSGKLRVLGNVLTQNYVLPTLRGKYGAYGASINFYENYMTASAAGLLDVDLFIAVMDGMGDYLRNLSMSQSELTAVIIPAVKEFDKWFYSDFEYGAQAALYGKTAEQLNRTREEMMSVTVEDLRGYADFVDKLVAQRRVYAVLGKEAAENAEFEFAYRADAETLEVTPCLLKSVGETQTGAMTRGDLAVLLDKATADRRGAENECIFKDVPKEAPYAEAVGALFEKNIMSGFGDGTFRPEKLVTRAELSAALSKFIFRGNGKLDKKYADLSEDDWCYEPMAKMINGGFIKPFDDGTVRPDEIVTFEEAVEIINIMGS